MGRTRAIMVSSTHWDREWYWPRERFRFELVQVMDEVIDTLERDPRFRSFTFDGQSIVVEDYLEIRPERRPALERLSRAGRLLFGPWYVQPDEFLVSGESLLRNFERGLAVAATVGEPLRLGYTPDMFGHIAQLPQLLRLCGMDTVLLTRGMDDRLDGEKVQTEFVWQGLDGSAVRALFQRHGYGNAANLGIGHVMRPGERTVPSAATALAEVEREAAALSPLSPTGVVLLNNGTDHTGLQPEIPDLLEHINRVSQAVEVVHGSYLDYLAAVPFLPERLARLHGELRGARYYPLLPGVLSSRVYLKQLNARCEALLCGYAEPLAVLVETLRGKRVAAAGFLDHAWQELLQNHPHDSICGCSVDAVHEENEVRFARTLQVGQALVDQAQRALGLIDAATPGAGLAVYSFSGFRAAWPVTVCIRDGRRLAESPLAAAGRGRVAVDCENAAGAAALADCRIDPARGADELTFLHRPERGCGVQILVPGATAQTTLAALEVRGQEIENAYLRLRPAGGPQGFALTDKRSGTTFGPLLLFHSFPDAGDLYDYQPLPVGAGEACQPGGLGSCGRMTMAETEEHRTFAALRFRTEIDVSAGLAPDRARLDERTVTLSLDSYVRVFAGHPVVHVSTTVENRASDHKMAVLFRLPEVPPHVVCGTQFGRVVRAAHDADVVSPIETIPPWHPFRDWLVAPGSKAGLAVVAPGLFEVGLPQHPYLALTLWRSVGWLSRPDLPFRPGDAGPAMETPGGQCLRPMTFSYALAAVDRDLVLADGMPVWQAAHLAAHPPMAWAVDVRGARPEDAWLLHVPAPEIVLSSIRRWRESGPVRVTLYNATDRAVSATVEAGFRFRTVRRCNMLSQPVRPESVAVRGSALDVAFGPFEIVCLEFEPA